MESLLSGSWERIVSAHCRNVEMEVCESLREACRLLRNTIRLLETEENEILAEMDINKSEVEKAKVKRDTAEAAYQKEMIKVGGIGLRGSGLKGFSGSAAAETKTRTTKSLSAWDARGAAGGATAAAATPRGATTESGGASSMAVASRLRKPKTMTHAQNERLLRVKRKREETRLTYSEKIAKLTHVLRKYNDVMHNVMGTWEDLLRRHHATMASAMEVLARHHSFTFVEEMSSVVRDLRRRTEPTTTHGGGGGGGGDPSLSSSSMGSSTTTIGNSIGSSIPSSSARKISSITGRSGSVRRRRVSSVGGGVVVGGVGGGELPRKRERRETATLLNAVLRDISKEEVEESDDDEEVVKMVKVVKVVKKVVSAGALMHFASNLLSPSAGTDRRGLTERSDSSSSLMIVPPTTSSRTSSRHDLTRTQSSISAGHLAPTMSFRRFRDAIVDEFGVSVYEEHQRR